MAKISSTIDEPEVDPTDSKPAEPASGGPPSKIGFFQSLTEYTQAQWEGLLAYVYRIAPITDRLATGNTTKYVMKYGGVFDEETLKHDLGSGKYRVQLNQIDARGKSKTIKTIEVDIEDPNCPPKVPEGEWLDDPRNKRWAWAKKKPEVEASAGSHQETWTPERVMNMVERLRPQEKKEDQVSITREVLNAVKETRAELGQANNPAGMMGMLKDLILLAKPESAKSDDSGMAQVVGLLTRMLETSDKRADQYAKEAAEERKNQQAERQRQHELELKRMELKQGGGQGDMLEVVDRVLGIKERLMEDSAPAQRRPGWPGLLEENADKLFELGKAAIGAFQGYQRAPQPGAPQPNPAPPPPVQQQQPTQPTPGVPPVPQLDKETEFLVGVLMAQGPHIVQAFTNDPNSGHELARMVILMANSAVYERIAMNGRDKILQTMMVHVPQMYEDLMKVGSPELVGQYIDDFVEGPDEPPEDPPEPKPTPKKKGAKA